MSGLNGDWYEALKGEFAKPYYRCISSDSAEGCEGCDPWTGSLS